jgi:hypothetical protein
MKRVLSESEISKFWAAFGDTVQDRALKALLLLGQRPGEIATCGVNTSATAGGNCPASP